MVIQLKRAPLEKAAAAARPGVLDGKAVAGEILNQLEVVAAELHVKGITPRLAVVQVGDDVASTVYIRHKVRACEKVGIEGEHLHLSSDVGAGELRSVLRKLNQDRSVHGVLLQLPLPEEMDSMEAMLNIAPEKDVDGFHPVNLGGLMAGRALLEPCTPTGVLTLLSAAGVDLRGKEAVMVGRSVIVGRPMALMLARANATVTLCHRHTARLDEAVRRADVVVVATGVPGLIRGEWLKEGAVVVDVGISRRDGRLVGDVEFESASKRTSWITPVPGGVGPMTVATLMENTLRAVCIQEGYLFQDQELISVSEAGLYFQRLDGLSMTRLCPK